MSGELVAPCPTPGCSGDGRYAAPGRGHRAGCEYPAHHPVPSSSAWIGDRRRPAFDAESPLQSAGLIDRWGPTPVLPWAPGGGDDEEVALLEAGAAYLRGLVEGTEPGEWGPLPAVVLGPAVAEWLECVACELRVSGIPTAADQAVAVAAALVAHRDRP